MNISDLVASANARLKAARIGVSIEFQGKQQNLYLRAILPPKPGSKRVRAFQQRIALKLAGTPQNVRTAELRAKQVGVELNLKKFDWAEWSDKHADLQHQSIGDWISAFEHWFWSARRRDMASETTWKGNYLKVFRKLPADEDLSLELLIDFILATHADSSDRRRTAQACKRLAKFAELEGWEKLRHLEGNYGPKAVNPRNLPSDALIVEWRETIAASFPGWGWILGMMAAYGLRNHEVFRADLSNFPAVQVSHGKTRSPRMIYPLYPQWAMDWNLDECILPAVELPEDLSQISNEKLGRKVTAWFCASPVPFAAYNLRHCYARRCFEFDIPVESAARSMGHSEEEHRRTYRAWIDEGTYRSVYERLVNRADAPKPPQRR